MTMPDLIVVGGGPAGVMAALTAARSGLSVAILDAKPLHRLGDKVCGDALVTGRLFQSLPPAVANAVQPKGNEVESVVDQLRIFFPSGKQLQLNLKSTPLVVVDRLQYGQRLLNDAICAGVHVLDSHAVVQAVFDRGRVIGVRAVDRRARRIVTFEAPLVIDASGASAIVRRSAMNHVRGDLREWQTHPGAIFVAYREILRAPSKAREMLGQIAIRYTAGLQPPGYVWYFSRGDSLNVGIGYKANLCSLSSLRARDMYRNLSEVQREVGDAAVVDSRGGPIPARCPLASNVAPGLIVAGDAAFHTDALTGEGHSNALVAGYWAGLTAAESFHSDDFSEVGLWMFNVRFMRQLGAKLASRARLSIDLERMGSDAFRVLEFVSEVGKAALANQGALAKVNDLLPIVARGLALSLLVPSRRHGLLYRLLSTVRRAQKLSAHYGRYPLEPAGLPAWIRAAAKLV